MTRLGESLLVGCFALVFEAPFLLAMFALVYGWNPNSTQWSLAVLLALAGALAAFLAAFFLLRRRRLAGYGDGVRLGLWAAAGFYLMWVFLFGVIPGIAGLEQGRLADTAGYFAAIVWIVLKVSYGVPILVGILGGLLYVALKRARLRGRA